MVGNTTATEYLLIFNGTGEFVIKLSAENDFGQSNLSASITIVVEEPSSEENPDNSKSNLFWYLFAGGWVLIAGFIGVAVVKVKKKK